MLETTIYGPEGRHAKVFTDSLDQTSRSQIQDMVNSELFQGCQVRIMPDVHAGKGSVIGFTSTMGDKICSNVVGVDGGCGVSLDRVHAKRGIDFATLDKCIRQAVPSGFSVRKELYKPLRNGNSSLGNHFYDLKEHLERVCRKIGFDHDRALSSIGTLGGGNHLIELDKTKDGCSWLTIHSGSRGFGAKVAEFHQAKAYRLHDAGAYPKGTSKGLAWLEGDDAKEYLQDAEIAKRYASLNRLVMAHAIADGMGWDLDERIESVHNYVDLEAGYIRKGAISAQEGEDLVIPISMAEGVIIGKGLGNADWNFSAPHGAGRLLARGEAKRQLSMEDFKIRMEGIWSSCIGTGTLDESPMAYKGLSYILERIQDSVEVVEVATPVYNFKAGGES